MKLTEYTPPEPFREAKQQIAQAVWENRGMLIDLSHRIHAKPELAFEEVYASKTIADIVGQFGFRVEHPCGRLKTAIRGTLCGGSGCEGPRIGILAEYDALPGLGHGCGHNLMAASGVGAAVALSRVLKDISGSVAFLGTPAEESGNGKQIMIEDGLFAGLDVALLFHPSDKSHAGKYALASEEIDVTFTGLEAHASAEPWKGRNALDAMILLFNSIALWRQQLEPDARVHGIISEGGTAPNIIPAKTAARFMIRSLSDERLKRMEERFREMAESAARASACEHQVSFSAYTATIKNNPLLVERFAEHMTAYGIQNGPPDEMLGSSDMGNVTQICPSIHPSIAICDPGIPKHSARFRDLSASERADQVVLLVSTLIAQTAYEFLRDPDLVRKAWEEFRKTV